MDLSVLLICVTLIGGFLAVALCTARMCEKSLREISELKDENSRLRRSLERSTCSVHVCDSGPSDRKEPPKTVKGPLPGDVTVVHECKLDPDIHRASEIDESTSYGEQWNLDYWRYHFRKYYNEDFDEAVRRVQQQQSEDDLHG